MKPVTGRSCISATATAACRGHGSRRRGPGRFEAGLKIRRNRENRKARRNRNTRRTTGMWIYEKKLQYPVRVSKCDPRMAKLLLEQYGGADGELSAALRYLNQRYSIPDKVVGLLTDIGTEEFAHLEMIATMVYKLTKDATPEQL